MRCRQCTPVPEEVRRAAGLLEGRWTVSILWASVEGASRFNEFKQAVGEIPPRTLAQRLLELEDAGLLERRVIDARPPRVEHCFNPPANPRRSFGNAGPKRLQDFKHRRRVDFMHRPRAQRRTIPLQRHFPLGAMLGVAPLGLLGGQEIIRNLPERRPPRLGQPGRVYWVLSRRKHPTRIGRTLARHRQRQTRAAQSHFLRAASPHEPEHPFPAARRADYQAQALAIQIRARFCHLDFPRRQPSHARLTGGPQIGPQNIRGFGRLQADSHGRRIVINVVFIWFLGTLANRSER